MSLIVNGTTIPPTLGSVKVGSTNVTLVVCNGTSVWATGSWLYTAAGSGSFTFPVNGSYEISISGGLGGYVAPGFTVLVINNAVAGSTDSYTSSVSQSNCYSQLVTQTVSITGAPVTASYILGTAGGGAGASGGAGYNTGGTGGGEISYVPGSDYGVAVAGTGSGGGSSRIVLSGVFDIVARGGGGNSGGMFSTFVLFTNGVYLRVMFQQHKAATGGGPEGTAAASGGGVAAAFTTGLIDMSVLTGQSYTTSYGVVRYGGSVGVSSGSYVEPSSVSGLTASSTYLQITYKG